MGYVRKPRRVLFFFQKKCVTCRGTKRIAAEIVKMGEGKELDFCFGTVLSSMVCSKLQRSEHCVGRWDWLGGMILTTALPS